MHVLLTNDDGIAAAGINAAYSALRRFFSVTVCAPQTEQSAIGHGITLNRPLRITEFRNNDGFFGYAVDGTPADCVKIAIRTVLKHNPPDLVVSGINHGPNLGADVMYSGTVSAAREGAILGFPAIALSLASHEPSDFTLAAQVSVVAARSVCRYGLPAGTLLNVNLPAIRKRQYRGMRFTAQGRSEYREDFIQRVDPRGRDYFWLTGKVNWHAKSADSDIKAVEDGYVSVTPLQLDLTDYDYLTRLRERKTARA